MARVRRERLQRGRAPPDGDTAALEGRAFAGARGLGAGDPGGFTLSWR
jgi:hypothetical protein